MIELATSSALVIYFVVCIEHGKLQTYPCKYFPTEGVQLINEGSVFMNSGTLVITGAYLYIREYCTQEPH